MDGHVSKPSDRRRSIDVIEPARLGRPGAPGGQRAAGVAAWSPQAMLERLGGDEDLTRQLVSLFLEEYPRLMAAVRASVGHVNADEVRRAAHALKGSIGNFTDSTPMTTAAELELLGRDNRLADAHAVLARLERDVAAFVSQLQQFERESRCAS